MAPFLTEIDVRVAIKGSRDPLGLQPIWGRLGRRVVGNLTTVSNSLKDFITLMMGFYFVEMIQDQDPQAEALPLFLKWEQMAAYARKRVLEETGFRGVERVGKNIAAQTRVTISADPSCQILANQRSYGLWGLYSVSARASGLLEHGQSRLTPSAREFVERHCLPHLRSGSPRAPEEIASLLKKTEVKLDVRTPHLLLKCIARLFKHKVRPEEKAFYQEHLLYGADSGVRLLQEPLAKLMVPFAEAPENIFNQDLVRKIIRQALRTGDTELASKLQEILQVEALLFPAADLFGFLLSRNDCSIQEVARQVTAQWSGGLEKIEPRKLKDLTEYFHSFTSDKKSPIFWSKICDDLRNGQFESAIPLLVEQNGHIMANRDGSGAWIEVTGRRLKVRLRSESADLPEKRHMASGFRHSYFLDSLWALVGQVERGLHG